MKNYGKKLNSGEVIELKEVAEGTFFLKFRVLNSEFKAVPGQYVSILCGSLTLRRPFSIYNFDKDNVEIGVLFKKKGEGTRYLSNLKRGDSIDFLGALGNGFEIRADKRALLVGAGIGSAPLFFLKKYLPKSIFIGGFRDKSEIFGEYDYVKIGGSICDEVEYFIRENSIEIVYSCGPKAVLEIISNIGKRLCIQTQVAMEKTMACSIGVCRGCVISLVDRSGMHRNGTVCLDGPVFDGNEVIW